MEETEPIIIEEQEEIIDEEVKEKPVETPEIAPEQHE